MFLKVKKFNAEVPILYGLNSMRAPFGVNMVADDILMDKEGQRSVPEGMFVVDVEGSVRFLPRTRLAAETATDSPNVVLKFPTCSFKVGDTLYGQAAGRVIFGGAVDSGEVVTLNVGGNVLSVTTASADVADLPALFVADHAAALDELGVTITALAGTSTLDVKATDVHVITGMSASGKLSVSTNTPTGEVGMYMMPLGSILAIGTEQVDKTRVITLAGNAAYALPEDSPVGTSVNKYLGIYPDALDFTEEPLRHVAPIVEADGVYENNLPYVDNGLKREFSDLRINKSFYKAA